MSHEYARRQAYAKKKKPNVVIKGEDGYLDPQTGKAEWENEFDREEMYENQFP
jgi:hypothetical protein